MSDSNKRLTMEGTMQLEDADFTFEAIYYEDEGCREKQQRIILAGHIEQALEYVKKMAFSKRHILSIKELGIAEVPVKSVVSGANRVERVKKLNEEE